MGVTQSDRCSREIPVENGFRAVEGDIACGNMFATPVTGRPDSPFRIVASRLQREFAAASELALIAGESTLRGG